VKILTRCDEEGVPKIVQALLYRYADMMYVIHLFDETMIDMPAEFLTPGLGMMELASETDFQQAEEEFLALYPVIREGHIHDD
jgi:hypothetical protein